MLLTPGRGKGDRKRKVKLSPRFESSGPVSGIGDFIVSLCFTETFPSWGSLDKSEDVWPDRPGIVSWSTDTFDQEIFMDHVICARYQAR